MSGREVTILLVEDDDGDNKLIPAIDGVEALEMLRGTNGREPIRGPLILLVDINMPRMDGVTLVGHLREDEHLKSAVVFILTTSEHESDMHTAYDLNVAGYIIKEYAGVDFLDLIHLLGGYSRIVELPKD